MTESALFYGRVRIAVMCAVFAIGLGVTAFWLGGRELLFLLPALLFLMTGWGCLKLAVEGGEFSANADLRAKCKRLKEYIG